MLNDWTNVAHGQWAKVGATRFRRLIDEFERAHKRDESLASRSMVEIEPTENGLTPKQNAIENLKAIGALRYSRDVLALADKYLPLPPSPIYDDVAPNQLPLPPPPERPLPALPSETEPSPTAKSHDVSRPLPTPPAVDFSELDQALEDLNETMKQPTLSIANSMKPRQDDDGDDDDW